MSSTIKSLTKKGKGAPLFYDPERDGVTFSLLSTFNDCREKARLHLAGWTSRGSTLAITFGNVAHYLNQLVYTDLQTGKLNGLPGPKYLARQLEKIERLWRDENPMANDELVQHFEFTMAVISGLMPEYYKYWAADDFKAVRWDELETIFKIPIIVTDMKGRKFKTFLRGKMDGVFHFDKDKPGVRRLFETKTKGRIDEGVLVDRIPFERQVSIYLSALRRQMEGVSPASLMYNLIRRPQLRQRKDETLMQFAERVVEDVKANKDWYFIRLQMTVAPADIDRGDMEINALISEFILWWNGESGHYRNTEHCENKYGTCQFLGVCANGDYSKLFKRKTVFRELEEGTL